MKNLLLLRGKCALITGGGTGIGLASSRAFIENGARVIITGRREEVLREARRSLGTNVLYRFCGCFPVFGRSQLYQRSQSPR